MKVDVLVVGAGPAGCTAAKRCAESGLDAVIVEMRKLPRDKVCSGVVSSTAAQRLVQREFGEIPRRVLADPYYYNGVVIHVVGTNPITVDNIMPVGWRRDIDFWMSEKATEAGARVYDGCIIKGIEVKKDFLKTKFLRGGEEFTIKSSYVIGCDGVRSTVRRSIFPDVRVQYQHEVRECYEGNFPIDRNFLHAFYVPGKSWFDINHKGEYFCLEISAPLGQLRERIRQAKEILYREYGFGAEARPVWRDACMEPRVHPQLIDGTFRPAKDRVLLAGDAAGFQLPNSEGIGTAILSGLMAAESIGTSIKQKKAQAAGLYLQMVSSIIKAIEGQLTIAKNSRYREANWDLEEVAEGIRSLMVKTMFEDTFSV